MKRALPLVLLVAACTYREVSITFGKTGEGLSGFICREPDGGMLLDRLGADGGTQTASLVTDIVDIDNGQPGCRTGQLLEWCAPKDKCKPMTATRRCTTVELPTGIGALPRDKALLAVREQMRTLNGESIVTDAPDEFVILRLVATRQPCSELLASGGALPTFDPAQLVGCAYSCPTLFDRAESSIYMGFETLTGVCEQGVRICASEKLNWVP